MWFETKTLPVMITPAFIYVKSYILLNLLNVKVQISYIYLTCLRVSGGIICLRPDKWTRCTNKLAMSRTSVHMFRLGQHLVYQ